MFNYLFKKFKFFFHLIIIQFLLIKLLRKIKKFLLQIIINCLFNLIIYIKFKKINKNKIIIIKFLYILIILNKNDDAKIFVNK